MWFFLIVFTIIVPEAKASMRSQGVLKTELTESVYRATLPDGFHFNEQAPNALTMDGVAAKLQLKSREAQFSELATSWSKARASLFVCDDAVTFCEKHTIELPQRAAKEGSVVARRGSAKTPSEGTSPAKKTLNKHGFFEDNYHHALQEARRLKKNILVDFSARWCPGCLRLEKEIFDLSEFKKMTTNFVKVKIDVDRFENKFLSEKYNIKGIPTLLIITPEQEEIDRLYDYQPIEILSAFFEAVKSEPTPIASLIKKIEAPQATRQDVERLAKRLLISGRAKESLPFFERIKPAPPEMATAQIEVAAAQYKSDEKTKKSYIKTLKDHLEKESTSSRSIMWRASLAGLLEDKNEKEKLVREGHVLSQELLSNPEKLKASLVGDLVGEFTGLEPLLIALYQAELVEAAGLSKEMTDEAWKAAAATGKNLNISPKRIGPALRYLLVLTKAELFSDAEALSREMLRHDPRNGDVQRRRLKILVQLKKFDEAVSLGKDSLKNSYGRNSFWVAESLAKAYVGLKRKKEAVELVESFLNREEAQWAHMKSSQKALLDLKKEIQSL